MHDAIAGLLGWSGAEWRKSSYSGGSDNCAEVAASEALIAVRDSKNPDLGTAVIGRAAWAQFISALPEGEAP